MRYVDLGQDTRRLLVEARDAIDGAYIPYVQRMRVGAAVLTHSNRVISGSNMEVAAVTAGLCAERCAVAAAHAQRVGDQLIAMAIIGQRVKEKSVRPEYPCPECRGVIREVADRSKVGDSFKIVLATPSFEAEEVITTNIGVLYPHPFYSGSELL
jgi:cytidine deaminase